MLVGVPASTGSSAAGIRGLLPLRPRLSRRSRCSFVRGGDQNCGMIGARAGPVRDCVWRWRTLIYKTWLFLHIVGVFLIVGGAGVATAVGFKASRSVNVRTIAVLSGLSIVAERFVITPGAILALVAGSALVNEVGYGFGAGWIVASYILWVVAMGIGWGILGRHSVRLNRRAGQLAAEGVVDSEELGREAAAPVGMIFGAVQNLILIAFIFLMVVRPGA